MPVGFPSVARNLSVLALTISAKRTVFGQLLVSFKTESREVFLTMKSWFYVAWLNILAAVNVDSPGKLIGINDLLKEFYSIYGRSFFSRYDYEEVPSEGANALVKNLNEALNSGSLNNTEHVSASTKNKFTVSSLSNFEYKDPIDHSVSKNQGQLITFSDGSRVVFRLSGTGSQGATVRMYVERYLPSNAPTDELNESAAEGLKGLIEVALEVSKLKQYLGVDKPTVITVSSLSSGRNIRLMHPLHSKLYGFFATFMNVTLGFLV